MSGGVQSRSCCSLSSHCRQQQHPFTGKRGDDPAMARAMKAGGFKLFRLQRPVDKVPETAQAVAEVMCPDLMGS